MKYDLGNSPLRRDPGLSFRGGNIRLPYRYIGGAPFDRSRLTARASAALRPASVPASGIFDAAGQNDDITAVMEGKKWPAVWGPKSFVDWIMGGYYVLKTDDEVPQAKTLAPAPTMIIDAVCAFYDVQAEYESKKAEM